MDEPRFEIRPAVDGDLPLILSLIRELAEYERLSHQVVATEASLRATLFGERSFAEVLIGEAVGKEAVEAVGFALFFHNYSTFLARPGLYLEDVYVRPAHRGRGYGRALLLRLGEIARERGCGRMEWAVLDWNRPAIDFYRKLGAEPMDEWTVFRLTGDTLEGLK
jgi:GNAT superfamily N-acetyltransferase